MVFDTIFCTKCNSCHVATEIRRERDDATKFRSGECSPRKILKIFFFHKNLLLSIKPKSKL